MAVYQGTRLRGDARLAAGSPGRASRAAMPASGGSAPRARPMGLLMAAIVAATMLGMVYLTQILGANATTYEIHQLELKRNDLIKEIKRHEVFALELTQAEAIVPLAQKKGLKRLGEPIVLTAP